MTNWKEKIEQWKWIIHQHSFGARLLFALQDIPKIGVNALWVWGVYSYAGGRFTSNWDGNLRKFPLGFHHLLKPVLKKSLKIGSTHIDDWENLGCLYLEAAIAGKTKIMRVLDDAGFVYDRKKVMESFEWRQQRLQEQIKETIENLEHAKSTHDKKTIKQFSKRLKIQEKYLASSQKGLQYLFSFKQTEKQAIASRQAIQAQKIRELKAQIAAKVAEEKRQATIRAAEQRQREIECQERVQAASEALLNLDYKTATPAQIQRLLEQGADINVMEKRVPETWFENTPVAKALQAENFPAFITLVNAGANLSIRMPQHYIDDPDYGLSMIEWANSKGLAPCPCWKELDSTHSDEQKRYENPFYAWFVRNYKFMQTLGSTREQVMHDSYRVTARGPLGDPMRYTYIARGKFFPMYPTADHPQRYQLPDGTILTMPTEREDKYQATRLIVKGFQGIQPNN